MSKPVIVVAASAAPLLLSALDQEKREPLVLSIPITLGAKGELPTTLRLFSRGVNDTSKGPVMFDEACGHKVMAAFLDQGLDKLPFDYGHAMMPFHPAQMGNPSEANKAAGWFKPVVTEDGHLEAHEVEFTPSAAKMVANKEYRFFSPAIDYDYGQDGDEHVYPKRLINCALTNLPATKGQKPLVAHQGSAPKDEPPMKTLLAALALAQTATEAEALAAVQPMKSAHDQLLVLTGTKDVGGMMGVIAAWKADADKVEVLSAELVKHEAAAKQGKLDALIAKGKAEGKITPALETFCRELGAKDESLLLSFLASTKPAVVTRSSAKQTPTEDTEQPGTMVDDASKRVAALTGTDLSKIAERRKARGGQVPQGEMVLDPKAE